MLDKKIRRYYRQMLFGNRNAFARLLDFFALRAIIYVAFLVWFSLQTSNLTLSFVLAAIVTCMISVALALYKNIRLDRFVQKKRTELSRDYMLERMVLMPRKTFLDLMGELAKQAGHRVDRTEQRGMLCRSGDEKTSMFFALQNHPSEPITAQQVLECYRHLKQNEIEKGVLLCTAPMSENAQSLFTKLPESPFAIWDRDKLLTLAKELDLLPDPKEVEQGILIDLELKQIHMKQLKKQALGSSRMRAYIVCGVVLFLASILTGQRVYYPIMGAVCFFMAFLSYFTGHKSVSE